MQSAAVRSRHPRRNRDAFAASLPARNQARHERLNPRGCDANPVFVCDPSGQPAREIELVGHARGSSTADHDPAHTHWPPAPRSRPHRDSKAVHHYTQVSPRYAPGHPEHRGRVSSSRHYHQNVSHG